MIDRVRAFAEKTIGRGYRFDHTLGVEEEVIRLASLFDLSEAETTDLRIAALLHDITKGLKPHEHKALYEHFSLPFGFIEENAPKTLHAVTGAYLARQTFPEVVNNTVFHCILYHTTAAPNMTMPEKLLYLADYIEPGRTFESCVKLRNTFYTFPEGQELVSHLNEILLLSLNQTLAELVDEHAYIHPTTKEARDYLLACP